VPGWSKRLFGTREKFSFLRWQGSSSGEVRRWMYSSILLGRTGKKGWEWMKRVGLFCCWSRLVFR
jgi:hypothetical protein